MHALVLLEQPRRGRRTDLLECLAALHEPAPETAAQMGTRVQDVLAGRRPQHRTAKDSSRQAQLRLDSTIEHCDEAFNTWSEDSHGPTLGPTRGGIGKALTFPASYAGSIGTTRGNDRSKSGA